MATLKQSIRAFDARLTKSLQHLPDAVRPTMQVASIIGEPVVVSAVAVGLLAGNLRRRSPQLTLAFASVLVSQTISYGLKLIWRRTRPDTAKLLGLNTYSFPSGHSYGSVVGYGLVGYLAYTHLTSPYGAFVAGLIVMLIVLIGLSRVYLGAHYPTDVLGGWALGLIILAAIIRISDL